MIGRDHTDIYITACGEPFDSRRSGVRHEKHCHECRQTIAEDHNPKADGFGQPESEDT